MKKNIFYIAKKPQALEFFPGYSYNYTTGELIEDESGAATTQQVIENVSRVRVEGLDFDRSSSSVLMWDKLDRYIGFEVIDDEDGTSDIIDIEISNKQAYKIALAFGSTSLEQLISREWYMYYSVVPHYKELKKKSAKENDQMFFRESLEGKINLFGTGYQLINNTSLEETLYLYVYRNNSIYASASFNKSDCRFDHSKKNVELNVTYNDKYSKILDAYENTYDIIKLAPGLTPVAITKRCVVQIYIQGEKTLSNYAGGTYWETDVDEQIDDADALTRKYYFTKGPRFVEINLQGFNYDINAAYRGLPDNNIWNAVSKREVAGQVYKAQCSIVFTKVANADQFVGLDVPIVKLLSSGDGNGLYNVGTDEDPVYKYAYDTYRIEIYTGQNGTGDKIYQSDYLFGKDADFTLAVGHNLYPMTKIDQPVPALEPTPNTFNLGEYVIEYQVWGRLLCDADKVPSHEAGHEGEYIDTYDLPRDDFATPRRNYRKCIGLRGFDSPNSVVTIWQNSNTVITPTSYGLDDFGEYFIPPFTLYGQYFYPLARSSWANTSLWVMLGSSERGLLPFEEYCSECYKEYTVKDTYHIADVIKAILAKIDPSIKHEKTVEYSSFLYGHSGGTASILGNCDLYITQKTNILKGEYDQAAQKAEIKFKQLMDMLRDCFRCYWFIDNQNRFRIEHISFFINGLSYNQPIIQLDLTEKSDKFNKKPVLYCQQEIEYDKADLISRYEFKYMDEVTKAMGGDLYVDINNKYIKKDKTEEINIDNFTADIDYMLFLPDDFSNDGFALLLADASRKVPIVNQQIKDEKQSGYVMEVYVQNWYASFNQLVWHYMEDISGSNLEYNNLEYLYAEHVKRCMKHSVEFPTGFVSINTLQLIKTDIGNGYIEEITSNIDTDLTEIELRYEPS